MPIYEYVCESCGHHLEALQKISEDPLVYCPECGADALRKKVSAAAFRLKGTGWYETDFKDKGKKKTESSTAKSNDASAKGSTKTDTKKTDSGTSSASSSAKSTSTDS
jgi:putative FmdB family regulatory protein